jgi:hypothetical protein
MNEEQARAYAQGAENYRTFVLDGVYSYLSEKHQWADDMIWDLLRETEITREARIQLWGQWLNESPANQEAVNRRMEAASQKPNRKLPS